jgi:acetyltransferase-like isoleucine patch superfamily enzyme
VTHDIPDYAIAVGVPAKVVGQVPLSNEAEDK